MWARALIIVLIASTLHGQEGRVTNEKKPCPEDVIPPGPGLTVHERHDLLRSGREEDFAVVLCLPQLPNGGCEADPHPSQTGIVAVAFEIDPEPGISMRYRDGLRYRPLVPGTPVRIRWGTRVLLLKMKAGSDVPLGARRLHGNLLFERAEAGKTTTTQQIAIDFQVSIAEHNAKVGESTWPFGSQVGRYIKDVALAPLAPIGFLLFVLACSTSNCDI